MTEQLARVPGRSAIAQAFRYALTHWDGLTVFLQDGRAALDTNVVERAMLPLAGIIRTFELCAVHHDGIR